MSDDREIRLQQAEERLQQARARSEEAWQAYSATAARAGRDVYETASAQVLEAERELADLRGDEYAIDLDIGMTWDIGAPLPHVLASDYKMFLVFYLREPVPGWDGSWVQVVDPAAEHAMPLGVVEFAGVHSAKFGGPNDEAIEGHPLSGKGLTPYGAHRVVNSQWITQQEQINSVHPMHRGGWHDRLDHYLFCFHDSTFECLARGLACQQRTTDLRQLLHELTNRLLD